MKKTEKQNEQKVLPGIDVSEKTAIKPEPFLPGYFKNKPRPDYYAQEVKNLVLKELLPKVLEWLEEEGESFYDEEDDEEETEEIEGVKEQLADVLDPHEDGFGMAYELKNRYYWECNDALVDILGNVNFYSAKQKAVLAWVRDNDAKPKFEIGKDVKIKISNTLKDGIVVDSLKSGEYVVSCSEPGHSVEGKTGRVIPWEELEKQNES
jgi:hypothetical protein